VFLHLLHSQNLTSLIIIASDASKCLEPGLYHLLFEKKHECIQLNYKENRLDGRCCKRFCLYRRVENVPCNISSRDQVAGSVTMKVPSGHLECFAIL
jgi:hypothetical protein